jgi:lipoprotein-anchoring transpeptidase ErfK/SrfK
MGLTLAAMVSMAIWMAGHSAVAPTSGNGAADASAAGGAPVQAGQPLKVATPMLTKAVTDQMAQIDWVKQVGFGAGIFVSIPEQMLYLVENGVLVWKARCSTAAAGVGAREGSLQTPTGWHRVETKIGDGMPWGQVFRSREATKAVWKPGMETKEDLVLTRVMPLDGLEPGVNQGKDAEGKVVDSKARGIYIHGTNGEENIGKPVSHGCIRLHNDDVITLFDLVAKGVLVYISEK